jgi:anti-sigma B factor antagonist
MSRQAGQRVQAPALTLVRDTEGTTGVVHARGELDLATAGLLVRAITAAASGPRPRVLVDLAEVEFCDSAGLRALLGAAREIEARAGRMVVAVVPGSAVDRLLELVGLREFLRVLPPEDARRAL